MIALFSRFLDGLWRGPIARNLGGALGIQLGLLVSGALSARLLGPQKRGYLAILVALPTAVGQLGTIGLSLGATYFLSSRRIGGSELFAVLRRPAFIQFTALTLLNSAIVLGYVFVSRAPVLVAAFLSLAVLPAALCTDYGIAFLLGARRHGQMSLMRVLSPVAYAGGMVALYVVHSRSVAAVMALYAATMVCAGSVALVAGVRAARWIHVDHSIVEALGIAQARKQLLAFGRKGYVGYLSPVDTFRIDLLVVGFLISPRALGIYVVGAAFTNLSRFIATNVGLSATADIASHRTHSERRRAVRRTLLLAGGLLTLVTLALGMFVIVAIPVLFGRAFRAAIPVAEILFVAGWLLALKRVAVDAMRGAGEARVGTQAELVNLALFLIACGPLGLLLGGPGVALALVFASAGGSLVLVRKLRRLGVLSTSGRSSIVAPAVHDV